MNNSGNSTRKTKWNYHCHMRILTVHAPHRWTYTEEFACVNFQFDKILCRCRFTTSIPIEEKKMIYAKTNSLLMWFWHVNENDQFLHKEETERA